MLGTFTLWFGWYGFNAGSALVSGASRIDKVLALSGVNTTLAGGTGGIGRFLGPTGGYLIGYLPAVFIIGWVAGKTGQRPLGDILAMVCGTIVLYFCGLVWLKVLTGFAWPKAIAVGMLPFLLGDALKIAVAVPIARVLRPIIDGQANVVIVTDDFHLLRAWTLFSFWRGPSGFEIVALAPADGRTHAVVALEPVDRQPLAAHRAGTGQRFGRVEQLRQIADLDK